MSSSKNLLSHDAKGIMLKVKWIVNEINEFTPKIGDYLLKIILCRNVEKRSLRVY